MQYMSAVQRNPLLANGNFVSIRTDFVAPDERMNMPELRQFESVGVLFANLVT